MELVKLSNGATLEAKLTESSILSQRDKGNKLAVCLHPWSWLGGHMDDPLLVSLEELLHVEEYHVLRFNSRGVGRSTGWASFSGFGEAKDLEELVEWALGKISDGYSHGSLIASLHSVLPAPIKTSHVLISYPLGPRGLLTLFHTRTYAAKLKELIASVDANVFIVFGDQDEFTAAPKYKAWGQDLEAGSRGGRLSIVEVQGGSHFWRGQAGDRLRQVIREWLL